MIVYDTIADKLYLWYGRDRLEIGMKNRLLGLASLVVSMAVVLTLGIEGLSSRYRKNRLTKIATRLGQGILLSRRNFHIAKKQCTMLELC